MSTKINLYKQSGTDVDTRVSFNVPRSLTYGLNARANDDGGVTESDNCEYNILNTLYGINYEPLPIQPETAAYLAFTGITGTTEVNAINKLVYELKQNNLWSKMKAVYPFVTDNRNLLSYTNTLTQTSYWSQVSVTLTSGQTDPTGGTNATRIVGTGVSALYGLISLTAGATYTLSCYVKSTSGSNQTFRIYANGGSPFSPNLTATSTWQQVTLTFTAIAGTNSFGITRDSSTNNFDILAYGIQMEAGSTATTYQPIATTQQEYISTQFKYNLIDGFSFKLVFNGGWNMSNQGATPNGVNGYADTQLVPLSVLTQNSTHISSYIRNTSQGVLLGTDLTYRLWIAPNFNGTQKYVEINSGATTTPSATISTTTGLWLGSRIVSSQSKLYNNAAINYSHNTASSGLDTLRIFISARNTGTAANYSSSQTAFSSIGDGLTDSEASILYSLVQQYQTFLNRAV